MSGSNALLSARPRQNYLMEATDPWAMHADTIRRRYAGVSRTPSQANADALASRAAPAPTGWEWVDLLGMTPLPGISDAAAGALALRDASRGDWTGAATNALGLVPFLPAVGAIRKSGRASGGGSGYNISNDDPALPPARQRLEQTGSQAQSEIAGAHALDGPVAPLAARPADGEAASRSPLHDPEGRPLTAPLIAGVRSPGGPDVPLSPEEVASLGRTVATAQIEGAVLPRNELGRYVLDARTPMGQGDTTWAGGTIRLAPGAGPNVLAHEVWHGLQYAQSPTVAVPGPVYAQAVRTMPINGRLPRATQNEEIFAEAFSRYAVDPAGFKRRSPLVAEWLRGKINADPLLSRHVQLNSLVPFLLPGAAAGAAVMSGDGTQ